MSVSCHLKPDFSDPALAQIEVSVLEEVNGALDGSGLFIDPYGDAKLLDAHIQRILALPGDAISAKSRGVFDKMKDLEVVYVCSE